MPTLRRSILGTAVMSCRRTAPPPLSRTSRPAMMRSAGRRLAAAGEPSSTSVHRQGDIEHFTGSSAYRQRRSCHQAHYTPRRRIRRLRNHLFIRFSANNCIATSSGMISRRKSAYRTGATLAASGSAVNQPDRASVLVNGVWSIQIADSNSRRATAITTIQAARQPSRHGVEHVHHGSAPRRCADDMPLVQHLDVDDRRARP